MQPAAAFTQQEKLEMEREQSPDEIRRLHHRLKLAVKHTSPEHDPDDQDSPFRGLNPHRELEEFEKRYGLGGA
jgi:DNA uptake protein ComE-like DNA-binding protein